jgi:hypothetical protein
MGSTTTAELPRRRRPMNAGPGPVEPPAHPLPQLTTYELRDYRRQLEHALGTVPERTPSRDRLQGRLADVLAEQDSRARVHAAGHP